MAEVLGLVSSIVAIVETGAQVTTALGKLTVRESLNTSKSPRMGVMDENGNESQLSSTQSHQRYDPFRKPLEVLNCMSRRFMSFEPILLRTHSLGEIILALHIASFETQPPEPYWAGVDKDPTIYEPPPNPYAAQNLSTSYWRKKIAFKESSSTFAKYVIAFANWYTHSYKLETLKNQAYLIEYHKMGYEVTFTPEDRKQVITRPGGAFRIVFTDPQITKSGMVQFKDLATEEMSFFIETGPYVRDLEILAQTKRYELAKSSDVGLP